MKKSNFSYMIAALVALVAMADIAAASEVKKVRATGQAVIYQNDLAAARDKALDDARRKAVEQAVGAMISSSTVTENFELLEDTYQSWQSSFQLQFEYLSEQIEQPPLDLVSLMQFFHHI